MELSKAPGPVGLPLVGSLFDVWRDPATLLIDATRTYGDFVRFRFGPFDYLLVNDPEGIHHVLVDNHANYTKSRNYRGLMHVLGNGLLTSEGEFWRRQRKLAQPAFHHQRLVRFVEQMGALADATVERWDRTAKRELDVHSEMMRLTLRIVGQSLFGTDLDRDAEDIGRALAVALEWAQDYAESLLRLPPWVPTPTNVRFHGALRALDGLVYRIIEERRKSAEQHEDLLAMLMSAVDETGRERMSDRQLRDEVMTLVLAGRETTASLLSFALRLLAMHPEIQERAAREAREVLAGRRPKLEDLPRLAYVDRVLNEAMRLYPPAWCFERQAVSEDVIGGYRIPGGAIVSIAPLALHRYDKYWPNPEVFDPDRFTPERSANRPRYAYLPFGDGPRVCIGKAFAQMEAKIVLASLLARYRFELTAGHRLETDAGITLRPKHGITMRIFPRDATTPLRAAAA